MKIEKNMVTDVEKDIIKKLKTIGETITYSSTADLFYEGQTPVVAYLLISGNIHLTKKKKITKTLGPGSLVGVKELMNHSPVSLSATVMPQAKVCFLSRSDIFEILDDQSELASKICELIAA